MEPYIKKHYLVLKEEYNPDYGDDKLCKCGHPYHRHFDWMEDNVPVGCKYCGCYRFIPVDSHEACLKKIDNRIPVFSLYDGWEVEINNQTFRYNHNDEDMGAEVVAALLTALGFEAKIEECC